VADGVEWPDGTVELHWNGRLPATSVWQSGIDAVHGHNGASSIQWLDEPARTTDHHTPR
jgi:hypothetical protein